MKLKIIYIRNYMILVLELGIDLEMYFVDKIFRRQIKFVDEIKNFNIIDPDLYGCFYHIDPDLYI